MPGQWDPFTGGDTPKDEAPAPAPASAPKKAAAPKAAAPGPPMQGDKVRPISVDETLAGARKFDQGDKVRPISVEETLAESRKFTGRKDPRPGHATVGEAFHGRIDPAARALVGDIYAPPPQTAAEAAQEGAIAGFPGGKMGMDVFGYIGQGMQTIPDVVVGKPVEWATGGRVTMQQAGDIATLLSPAGEWALAEREAALGARTLGVSTDAYRSIAEGRAVQEQRAAASKLEDTRLRKARKGAALKLIAQADRERTLMSGGTTGKGELKAGPAKEAAEEWERAHPGLKASLSDVAPQTAVELTRKAGAKGGTARDILTKNLEAVRTFMKTGGRDRTLQETPHPRSPPRVRAKQIEKAADEEAATTYRAPWAFRFKTDQDFFNIVFNGFAEGPEYVREAMKDAGRRFYTMDKDSTRPEVYQEAWTQYRDLASLDDYLSKKAQYEHDVHAWDQQLAIEIAKRPGLTPEQLDFELADFKKTDPRLTRGPPEFPEVSAGALDRIHSIGESAVKKLERSTEEHSDVKAGGVSLRMKLLDQYLQKVPGLPEARAAYKDKMRQIELLNFEFNINELLPDDFAAYMRQFWDDQRGLTPGQKTAVLDNVLSNLAAHFGRSEGAVEIKGGNAPDNIRLMFTMLGRSKAKADAFIAAIEKLDRALATAERLGKGALSHQEERDLDVANVGSRIGVAWALNRFHSMIWLGSEFFNRWISQTGPLENETLAKWMVQRDRPVEETLDEILNAIESYRGFQLGHGFNPKNFPKLGELEQQQIGAILRALKERTIPDDVMKILQTARLRVTPAEAPHEDQKDPDDPSAQTDVTDPNGPAPPPGDPSTYKGDPFTGGDTPAGETPAAAPAAAAGAAASAGEVDTSVPTDINGLLDKIAFLEKSGDESVSPAGAIGKYQVWPKTARGYNLDVSRLKDPAYNRYAASVIAAEMYNRFNGDLGATLAEYNGGRGRQWLESGRNPAVLKYETRKYLYRAGIITADQVGQPEEGGGEQVAGGGEEDDQDLGDPSTSGPVPGLNITIPPPVSYGSIAPQ